MMVIGVKVFMFIQVTMLKDSVVSELKNGEHAKKEVNMRHYSMWPSF